VLEYRTFFFLHRHTGPVADFLPSAGYAVENGGFAGIGISGQRNRQPFVGHEDNPVFFPSMKDTLIAMSAQPQLW
jgi:hypothetical protein